MDTTVVRANVPRDIKRQLFSYFAMHELTFSDWLREEMENFAAEISASDKPLMERDEDVSL